ncbi:MAG: Fic family protein [Alphaproteobacteria bacterium]|nr:Fic family protein [Alphaproteobacteria bacterium]
MSPNYTSYEFEIDTHYCYPKTQVLINKLNIQNENDLLVAEKQITSVKIAYLLQNPIEGKFDLSHLQKIHRFIFSDIYDWAGEIRTVNISKGNQFCLCQNIQSYAESIFQPLKKENYLKNSTNLSERLAYYFSEINVLHPFREGNGRTQRVFIKYLATNAGANIDFSSVSSKEMFIASANAFACQYKEMIDMFTRITTFL